MNLYSTIFFLDGNPVGYKIFQEPSGRYALNPAEHPGRQTQPPVVTALFENGQWKVEGTSDQNLIDQIVDELTICSRTMPQRITAAP